MQEDESESEAGVAGSLPKHWERVKGTLPFSEKKEGQKCGSRGRGQEFKHWAMKSAVKKGALHSHSVPSTGSWSPSSQRSLAGSSLPGGFGICPVLRFGQSEK